jgi:Flp pilus assembly pilin Flp
MLFKRSPPWHEEGGQGLTEYSLILLLVAVAVVTAMTFFGAELKNAYCDITYELRFILDQSSSCDRPIVQARLIDRGPEFINLEARVRDPDGDPDDPYEAIAKVEFYIDSASGSPVTTEYQYRYCLGAGDNPCQNYYIGDLSLGEHRVIIMAYDDDGNVGIEHFRFTR